MAAPGFAELMIIGALFGVPTLAVIIIVFFDRKYLAKKRAELAQNPENQVKWD